MLEGKMMRMAENYYDIKKIHKKIPLGMCQFGDNCIVLLYVLCTGKKIARLK